jgi:hypothetical protein
VGPGMEKKKKLSLEPIHIGTGMDMTEKLIIFITTHRD